MTEHRIAPGRLTMAERMRQAHPSLSYRRAWVLMWGPIIMGVPLGIALGVWWAT